MDQIAHKRAVIQNMLENIRKKNDVRVRHFLRHVTRGNTLDKSAVREVFARKRHGLHNRFHACAIVLRGKSGGIAARAASDVEKLPACTDGNEP